MNEKKSECRQLGWLVFVSLLAESLIRPFGMGDGALPARLGLFGGGIGLVTTLVLFLVYSKTVKNVPTQWVCRLLCAAFLLSVSMEILQGQKFYDYVMDRPPAPGVFLVLVLAAAWYGAYSGLPALGRASGAVAALAAASGLVLLASIWTQLRFSQLQAEPLSARQILASAADQFYLPPALVLLPVLKPASDAFSSGAKALTGAFVAASGLRILGEMTMGAAYAGQEQPLYTVARLGGISVFRRLDALHICVWMLLFVLKISFYLAGFCRLWQLAFRGSSARCARLAALIGVPVILLLIWGQSTALVFGVQQILLGLGMLFAMLFPFREKEAAS